MADNKLTEKPTRKTYKKATSKRRVVSSTEKNSEPSNDNHESSPPPKLIPIQERTVIGQEAPSKLASSLRQNIQSILNRSKVVVEFSENVRSEADGREDSSTVTDAETEALSRLRCTSECTEAIAEREKRRRQRCADYPGLAFGSSIFSSDTLMKFSVIRNELHNILKSQLKRTESEVIALNRRIQSLEGDLQQSEEQLNSATVTLAEASQAAAASERNVLEHGTDLEEDKVALLETQLARAKLMAEEADKKCGEIKLLYDD